MYFCQKNFPFNPFLMANSTKIDYYASTAQVIVLDPQFNVLESEDQFITLHKGENLIDKDPFFEKIKTAFVNGGPFEFGTVLLKSLDNNKVFNIKLIDGDNKTIILQDVTSFKPSSSNFESSAFYHHLRSPLASISNLSEVLKLTALNRDQLEIVNQLEISTKKGLSFIEELSMANQFSRGKLTVQQREFDAAKVTASILDFMRIEAVEKGIAKFPKVSKKLHQTVIGDEKLYYSAFTLLAKWIFQNIMSKEVDVKIRLNASARNKVIIGFEILVHDHYYDEKQLAIMNASLEDAGSHITYLPYLISREIIDRLGGKFQMEEIDQEKQEGTCFKVSIPFKMGTSNTAGKVAKQADGEKSRILLVEDIDMTQMIMIRLLKKYNKFSIDTAKNGEIALQQIHNHNYDAVILDLNMPVMDGFELTREIRKLDNPVKSNLGIIALSAHISKTVEQEAYDAGVNQFFSKPVDTDDLIQALDKITR